MYSRGESEEIVGKALAGGRRDSVVLATKVHGTMGEDPNQFGNSRRWIVKEVENSLRRLSTDWIDLYQIHRPEPDTDIDETLAALSDLVHAGKVRYIGSSTFPAHQIVEAQWVAERRGRERFVCEQPPYSMLIRRDRGRRAARVRAVRDGRDPVEPARRRLAVGPLPQGRRLARRQQARADDPLALRHVDSRQPGASSRRRRRSASSPSEAGMSLIEMALAFVANHPAVTAAIIGPRTIEQLESQLPALERALSADVLDRIDEIVAPGVNVNQNDTGWDPPWLTDSSLRRR